MKHEHMIVGKTIITDLSGDVRLQCLASTVYERGWDRTLSDKKGREGESERRREGEKERRREGEKERRREGEKERRREGERSR